VADVEGTLFVARSTGPGVVREEQLSFRDLQSLLDACTSSEGTALVRVEIVGTSAGERGGKEHRDERDGKRGKSAHVVAQPTIARWIPGRSASSTRAWAG